MLQGHWVDQLHKVYHTEEHETHIFPEVSNRVVVFTSGSSVNTFGSWSEITDGTETLSSKFSVREGRITSIIVEDFDDKDVIYDFELSYGDSKTIITRGRVLAGNVKVATIQSVRCRGSHIPKGETVYYRCMSEVASSSLQIAIRYYLEFC